VMRKDVSGKTEVLVPVGDELYPQSLVEQWSME